MAQGEIITILLSVIGFVGIVAVTQLMRLAGTVSKIEITIERIATMHEDLERRVEKLEEKIFA